jgi:hypothetical protein
VAKFLQLALWNANGLTQYIEELKIFISHHNIDVMLISEMHFTDKSYLKLPKYIVYHANHPAGTAYGRTARIIITTIKHYLHSSYKQDFLLANSVSVEESDNSKHLFSGEPTYWPSDRNNLPDLVNFCHKRYSP